MLMCPPTSSLFPYTTLFRSADLQRISLEAEVSSGVGTLSLEAELTGLGEPGWQGRAALGRSEEHTSELQSRGHLVCRLLLEKKKHPTRRRGLCRCTGPMNRR